MTESIPLKFISGGVACMVGDVVSSPFDVIKVRRQNTIGRAIPSSSLIMNILNKEGPFAFWKGIVPSLMRQAIYGTLRVGMYDSVKNSLSKSQDGVVSFYQKVTAGLFSGSVASAIASPTDRVRLLLQNQSHGMNKYRGVYHTFRTIVKETGFRGLYLGVGQTVQRAAVANASELVTYDAVKTACIERGCADRMDLHIFSGICSGLVGASLTTPLDFIKTRRMTAEDPKMYRGTIHCIQQVLKHEGPRSFYKGFIPYCARNVPWTIAFFCSYEQIKHFFLKLN